VGGAGGSISALCIACSDPLEDIQQLPVEAASRDIQTDHCNFTSRGERDTVALATQD